MIKKLFSIFSKKRANERGIFEANNPIGIFEYQVWNDSNNQEPDYSNQIIEETERQKKLLISPFHLIIAVVICFFVLRLINLQISYGQENYLLAEGNRLRENIQLAPRGLIFDKNGIPLVQNVSSFVVELRLADLPNSRQTNPTREEVIRQIASAIEVPFEQLNELIVSSRNRDTLTLVSDLNRDQSLAYELRLHNLPAVSLIQYPIRQYSSIVGLSHILGYTGRITQEERQERPELPISGSIGKTGVERVYDRNLQGELGIETLEVDALNRVVRTVGNSPAEPGSSLILGVDSVLQQTLADSLQQTLDRAKVNSASAVVMDVRTGEIRAMVSLPSYDNNIFSSPSLASERVAVLNDANSPMVNRAISGQYPLGSTVKPMVAAAALEERTITGDTRLDTSSGAIEIGQWRFVDWRIHGITNVRQAIAESNNIFFYALGGGYQRITGLGIERLTRYYRKFGFGQRTGIDLPGEEVGLVPNPDWKKRVKNEDWFVGDTYNISIGQGDFLATPLQLTRATAAIANWGKLIRPRVVRSIISNNGSQAKEIPTLIEDENFISRDNIAIVREGMRQTVTNGSARSFNNLPVEVAAKTGTAQFDFLLDRTHAWFTAFAPYQDPEIAISVIIESGGEGYLVAAPVARNIIERYFNIPLTPIPTFVNDN